MQNLFVQNRTLACASLGLIEVIATLARKQKAGEIALPLLEQKVLELEEDWGRFIQVHLTTEVVDIAKELARGLALRGADAIHLASALLLQKSFAEEDDLLVFIASDHELKKAAQSSGLIVIDPEEQEQQTSLQAGEERQEE